MTLRRSDVCCWLLAGSLLAAAPVLAQKKTNKPLTPAQQAERAKFDPKAEASPFGGHVVEESVAQVNDQIINTSDYNRAETQLEQEGRQQGWSEQELEDHKRDLLRDLIDQQLLLSKGKDLDITGETELVRRLDEIRKQNHLDSMDDLEKAASSQGVSYEDFKQNIRNGIITQQVIRDEVGRHIQMTDAQLQQYYRQHLNDFTQPESVRLSEILIPVKTSGDEAADLAAAKPRPMIWTQRSRLGPALRIWRRRTLPARRRRRAAISANTRAASWQSSLKTRPSPCRPASPPSRFVPGRVT